MRNAFSITLGANVGTTVTALLAATVTGSWGLVIALVHFCFNLLGTAMIYPIPAVRDIPVVLAQKLARLTIKNRFWAVLYVAVVFVVLPLVGMLIFKD
jgi:sodium-dependent phosphate cotransporter